MLAAVIFAGVKPLAARLPDEAIILGRMAEATARDVFVALARVQRVMPGSRLRSVEAFDA